MCIRDRTIGGLKPAYFYVKSALESGRHVVTSNKELVATHGGELLRTAKELSLIHILLNKNSDTISPNFLVNIQ